MLHKNYTPCLKNVKQKKQMLLNAFDKWVICFYKCLTNVCTISYLLNTFIMITPCIKIIPIY